MKLHQLSITKQKKKIRLGRGNAGKGGTTAGRGTKGQKSRSGYNLPKRFEGGQTSLIQKLPKVKGFKSIKNKPQIVKISQLDKVFSPDDKINSTLLYKKGLVENKKKQVKILADKKINKKLNISGCLMSKKVEETIK